MGGEAPFLAARTRYVGTTDVLHALEEALAGRGLNLGSS